MSARHRIALLGDVHGNLPALRAVLADIRRAGITSGALTGDLVMRGTEPAGCIAAVRALGWPCARGNTDHKVGTRAGPDPHHPKAGRVGSRAWTVNRLSDADRRFLAELPPLVRLHLDPPQGDGGARSPGARSGPRRPHARAGTDADPAAEGGSVQRAPVRVVVMHGGPDDPREVIDRHTPATRLTDLAAHLGADVIVNGHTHDPLARRVGDVLLVNPGAVGEGRAADRHPRWAWLEVSPDGVSVGLERVAAGLATPRR